MASNNKITSEEKNDYIFTVFTPTYNRAHTLLRVYKSLQDQTYKKFEWLIVDDGSTDETKKVVKQWIYEASFPIRYFHQENQGKHIAHNLGVRESRGELFLSLDSDDACVPKALERFHYHWNSIPKDKKNSFSAVTSLCHDQQGNPVGNRFPYDPTDSDSLEIKYLYKVKGEKWGFHRTSILRQFPFPEIKNANFVPEGVVWTAIAKKYKTRFINESLRTYYRGEDQLTAATDPSTNAFSHMLWFKSRLNDEIEWIHFAPTEFLRAAAHYSRFSFHNKRGPVKQVRKLNNILAIILWGLMLPIGLLAYLYDAAKKS